MFFDQHNGGAVWFDELGWPWPKHACFDQSSRVHFDGLLERLQSLGTDKQFGVVMLVAKWADRAYQAKMVAVSLSDRSGLCGKVDFSAPLSVGDLVAVVRESPKAFAWVDASGRSHAARALPPAALKLSNEFLETGIAPRQVFAKASRRFAVEVVVTKQPECGTCAICGASVPRLVRHMRRAHGCRGSDRGRDRPGGRVSEAMSDRFNGELSI